jgi:hypothetical protein
MAKISGILVQFGTGFTCYGAPKKSDASECIFMLGDHISTT